MRYAKIQYRTRTRVTCFGNTAGISIPVRNPIQDKLHTSQDVEISIYTLSQTISHLDMTNKHITKKTIECDELLCATWQVEMAQYNPRQIVFIDEAGVDNHTISEPRAQYVSK